MLVGVGVVIFVIMGVCLMYGFDLVIIFILGVFFVDLELLFLDGFF